MGQGCIFTRWPTPEQSLSFLWASGFFPAKWILFYLAPRLVWGCSEILGTGLLGLCEGF